jgi:hypothetical protein
MAMARGGPPREDVGLAPYGHLRMLPLLTEGGAAGPSPHGTETRR